MKKLCILNMLLLVCTISLSAQAVFSLQQSYKNEAFKFGHWVDNELLILGAWQNEIGEKSTGISAVKIFTDSIEITPKTLIKGEDAVLMHFIKRHNSSAYIGISYEKGCRYLAAGNYIYNISEKLEGSGKPARITYFFINISEPITMAQILNESTLILGNKNILVSYDLQTRKAIAFNDSLASYSNLIPLSDEQFVVTENNKFHIYNSQCNLVSSSIMGLAPKQLSKLHSGSGYLAIANQKLVVLNNSGNAIYSHNWQELAPTFDTLERFFWHQDTLMVLGIKNEKWILAQLDVSFSVIKTYNLPLQNKKPLDILCKDNMVYTLVEGNGAIGQRIDNLTVFNRTKSLKAKTKDLQISHLQMDSIIPNGQKPFLHPKFYLSVELTNFDTLPVKTVYFNWKSSYDNECNTKTYSEKHFVNLESGETDTFEIVLTDSFLNPETLYQTCLNISCSNGQNMTNLENATSCVLHLLPPLSLSNSPQAAPIIKSVYKQDECFSLTQKGKLRLIDLVGRIYELGQGTEFKIPNGLNEGVYFLYFEAENTHLCKKIFIIN